MTYQDYVPLMGKAFTLTRTVKSIPIPAGYLDPDVGITMDSLRTLGDHTMKMGNPRKHKNGHAFVCYRAANIEGQVYYFCLSLNNKGARRGNPKIYVFNDDDLVKSCYVFEKDFFDAEVITTPEIPRDLH